MEAQAQRAEFWTDLASAARALVSQPAVPVFSIGAMLLPTAVPTSGQHSAVVSWATAFVNLAVSFVLLGWYGAERVFFQRHLKGTPVTFGHLLGLVPAFMGRFVALGVLCSIVLFASFALTFAADLTMHSPPDTPPAWFFVTLCALFVAGDFVLTFVTPALAYTTRSAVHALRIGFAMIRQTWPRCALYVLCAPLALNVLHLIYPTRSVGLQLALTVVFVVVGLLAKGAIAAFCLRERGSYSDDGAGYM